jgi:hypothetical protein
MNKFIAVCYDGNQNVARLVDTGDGPFGKIFATDLGLPSDWDILALVEAPNGLDTMVVINDDKCRLVDFPGIRRAALCIALDNGGINRERSEQQMLEELYTWLELQPVEDLFRFDPWLKDLSDEALETVCCDSQSDAGVELMKGAPAGLDDFLNAYFDQVC